MKRSEVEWPKLLEEGGWQHLPDGTYWGYYKRDGRNGRLLTIYHCGDETGWRLLADGQPLAVGDLDGILTEANDY